MKTRFCKCGRRLRNGEKRCPHCGIERKKRIRRAVEATIGGIVVIAKRKQLKEGAKWVGRKAVKIAKDNGPKILEAVKQILHV